MERLHAVERKLASRWLLILVGLAAFCALPAQAGEFDPGRTPLVVEIRDALVIPYRVFAIFVLPSEELTLRSAAIAATADAGRLDATGPGQWSWVAPPEPGIATLELSDGVNDVRLNAFVLHPADAIEDGRLHDYTVGDYPEPLDGDPVYEAPDGFVELEPSLADVELSPHFRLGQFPSKQSVDYPKYLVLREALLLKLELLLERLNEVGVAAESLTVMSGFRTPAYNRAIGNGRHSRHIYGGAADIYVDVSPRDDVMDDLNRDGIFDHFDAQWLYGLANELFARPEHLGLDGGLGVYDSTAAHGPFLHMDARGRRARWGLLP